MKKGRIGTITLILVFIAGLFLLLYPTVSNYWNSLHQSRVITDYSNAAENLDRELYGKLWAEAEIYNRVLAGDKTVGGAADKYRPSGDGRHVHNARSG